MTGHDDLSINCRRRQIGRHSGRLETVTPVFIVLLCYQDACLPECGRHLDVKDV